MVFVNVLVAWLHLVAGVIFVGSLLTNMLTIAPAMATIEPPPMRGKIMAAIVHRHSKVMAPTLAVLVLTGVFELFAKLSSPAVLVSTPYGIVLLSKIVLSAAMIVLGFYIDAVIAPKIAAPAPIAGGAAEASGSPASPARAQQSLVRVATDNLVLGLLVLGAVAVMRSV